MTTSALFIGDSITAGTGADSAATAYLETASSRLGWTAINNGVSSTGYINRSGPNDNYNDRIAAVLASAGTPDVVVVQGSTNDYGVATAAQIQTAATTLFATIRAALPAARLYGLGYFLSTVVDSSFSTRSAAIGPAVTAVGGSFIDPIALGWLSGGANAGHPDGSGNTDYYLSDGGIHPTQAGHDYMGIQLALAVSPLPLPLLAFQSNAFQFNAFQFGPMPGNVVLTAAIRDGAAITATARGAAVISHQVVYP